MNIERQRAIMNDLIINNIPLSQDVIKEILLDDELKKDTHPLLAIVLNHLIEKLDVLFSSRDISIKEFESWYDNNFEDFDVSQVDKILELIEVARVFCKCKDFFNNPD